MGNHSLLLTSVLVLGAVACGDDAAVTADDASVDGAPDARASCTDTGTCALTCDPAETWLALTGGIYTFMGDADPASPAEVGDGMWHLFVGVLMNPGASEPKVALYDSTSSTPQGPYTLGTAPLTTIDDTYDQKGQETPAYFRADEHTEYLYYCAIESYSPLSGRVAALQRTDGAAWTKIGVVSDRATEELVECEPTVARDPVTGQTVLAYLSLEVIGDTAFVSTRTRTSSDPTSFPASTVRDVWREQGAATSNRLAMSFDERAQVWRFAFDRGSYPTSQSLWQAYAPTPLVTGAELAATASNLHAGDHASHLDLHQDLTCLPDNCPQGPVLQSSKAIYPDDETVIFFYAGFSNVPALQVNGQRCRRTSP